jgi:hypothetical protein
LCIFVIYFFLNIKRNKNIDEMERLLKELIKESPTKARAKKPSEENLKQKIDELRIDEENKEYK